MSARTSIQLALVIGAASLALRGGDAQAHFTKQVNGPVDYWFSISHIPDLDQIRTDLANDGRLFCTPTTGFNWLGYLTNHGAPVLETGPTDWESQSNYDVASFLIGLMATPPFMDTNPTSGGTTVLNSVKGLRAWLGSGWVVNYWMRDEHWSPSHHFLASKGLNGAYLMPGVGWYLADGDPCPYRAGGHVFAVAGMHRQNSSRRLDIRDPATDDDEVANVAVLQSAFTTESYYCVREVRNPKCGNPAWQPRTMIRVGSLTRDVNGFEATGYLDYVRSIFPMFVATAIQTDEITYSAVAVEGGLAPVRSYMTSDGEPIHDMVLGADLGHALVIVGTPGATALWKHTPGFETWESIDVGAEAPSDVVAGRHREAYVLSDDGTRLICFDVDDLQFEDEVMLPAQGQALAYDDDADEVIVLSLTEHAIMRYPRGLQDSPTLQFPDDLPFGEEASIDWDPSDGAVWCIVDGDPQVYRVPGGANAVEVVEFPALSAPQAIGVGDDGRVYVSDLGNIKEYTSAGPGSYGLASDPFFEGREAGAVLSVARGRTNDEPHLEDEEWFDALPTGFADSVPDCVGDLDGNGDVGFGDLTQLLAAWGSTNASADLDGNGSVGFGDLTMLLAAWGPCP